MNVVQSQNIGGFRTSTVFGPHVRHPCIVGESGWFGGSSTPSQERDVS